MKQPGAAAAAAPVARRRALYVAEPATATRHGLGACDAACLVLATALQAPLLTFDKRLAEAAARELGPLP